MDGARRALPVTETTAEVVDTASEMPVGPSTTELLLEGGTETTLLTLDNAGLQSPHSLERVDVAEHPQTAEGARVAGGVSSSGTATQSQKLSSGWSVSDPELGLFFRRGCQGGSRVW